MAEATANPPVPPQGDFVIPLKGRDEKVLLGSIDETLLIYSDYVEDSDRKKKDFQTKENTVRNSLIMETNRWMKEIYSTLSSGSMLDGIKSSIGDLKSFWANADFGSSKPGALGGGREQEILTNLRDSLNTIGKNTTAMQAYSREGFRGMEGRKKLDKDQNESSGKMKEWMKEKGGFFKGLAWLGKSIYFTIAKFMGSTLWEIIKTVLFFLLFDPDGTFLKSIWNFFKDVMGKLGNAIWAALPDSIKNWLAETLVFFSRIGELLNRLLSGIYTLIAYAPGTDTHAWLERASERQLSAEETSYRNQQFDTLKTLGLQAHQALTQANKTVDVVASQVKNVSTKDMLSSVIRVEVEEFKDAIRNDIFMSSRAKAEAVEERRKELEEEYIKNGSLARIRNEYLANRYEQEAKNVEIVGKKYIEGVRNKVLTGKITTESAVSSSVVDPVTKVKLPGARKVTTEYSSEGAFLKKLLNDLNINQANSLLSLKQINKNTAQSKKEMELIRAASNKNNNSASFSQSSGSKKMSQQKQRE